MIDMRTVLFSYIISNAICAIVMASLWWRNRQRSPELVFWLTDFIMQFAGLLLVVLRGALPDFFSIVVANSLVIGGTLLLFIGLERYTRETSLQWHNYIYLTAFVLVQTYFLYVQPNMQARTNNLSLALLVICLQCAWLLLRRVEPAMRPDTRGTGVVFGIFSLVSLGRIFLDFAMPMESELFKTGLYDTLVILTYQMLYIGLTFALFLLVSRRLLNALESDLSEKKMVEAEGALKISEERFSIAFQMAPYSITITRVEDGRFIDINEAFTLVTGFTRAEAIAGSSLGLNLWVNEEDRQNVVKALGAGQSVTGKEVLFRRKNGEILTGLFSARIIQLSQGPCILSTINDITERKRAEDALKESEERLAFVLEGSQLGYWDWNIETGQVQRNTRWAEMLGYTLAEIELNVKQWTDLHHPDDSTAAWKSIQDHLEGRTQIHNIEYRMRAKDGQYKWILDCAKIVKRDAQGRPLRMCGTHADITERKRAEDALSESELKYRSLIESSSDAIFCVDEKGQYQFTNQLFASTFGQTPDYFIGKTFWDVYPKEHADYRFEATTRVFQTGKSESLDVEVPLPDKTLFFYATANPIKDETGKVILALTHAVNITERKQAEDALRESESLLRTMAENYPNSFISIIEKDLTVGYTAGQEFNKLNLDPNQFVGLTLEQVFGEHTPFIRENYLKTFGGVETQFELFINDQHQYYRTVPLMDQHGRVNRILAVVENITERKQADAALLKSEEKYRLLVETADDVILQTDLQGRHLFRNSAYYTSLGYEVGADVEMDGYALVHPDDVQVMKSSQAELLRTGKAVNEYRVRHRSGNWVYRQSRTVVLYDAEHKPESFLAIISDITERKQAEEERERLLARLQQGAAELDAIFNALPYLVSLHGKDGSYLRVNPTIVNLFGFDPTKAGREEIAQRLKAHFPDGQPLTPRNMPSTRALAGEIVSNVEYIITDARGEERTLLYNAIPLNVGGEVQGAVFAQEDITERKRAEEEVKKSHEQLLKFASQVPGMLYQFEILPDGSFRVPFTTEAIRDIFGCSPEDVREDFTPIAKVIHPEDLARVNISIEESFRNMTRFQCEYRVLIPGQPVRWVWVQSMPEKLPNGSVIWNGFNTDITERVQAEVERERLLAELDQKNKELEGLIQIASHDMRSPLVTVQGFCGNIQKYCGQVSEALEKSETLDELRSAVKPLLEEKIPNALRFIDSSSLKMHTLVNGLLRLSRVGRATLQKEEVEMPLMLQRILDTLAFQIEKCNAQVIVETPLVECYGDNNQLNQVFSNLLDNAVKYRDAERPLIITISSRVEGQKTIYTIADTGIGISSEDQKKIWTIFHRVGSDETVSGEGLGLALVKRIVERHCGRVWVESDFGIGSRFHVELPLSGN